MSPYYYNLGRRIISDSLSAKLIRISQQHHDDFVGYVTRAGQVKDGNNFIAGARLDQDADIRSLRKSIRLTCYPLLMMHAPGTKVLRHVDDANRRNSVIITPLLPVTDFAPTHFYQDDRLVATCDFKGHNSCLINTQIYHDLENNSEIRLNFQLSFDEPFERVLELLVEDRLFDR